MTNYHNRMIFSFIKENNRAFCQRKWGQKRMCNEGRDETDNRIYSTLTWGNVYMVYAVYVT